MIKFFFWNSFKNSDRIKKICAFISTVHKWDLKFYCDGTCVEDEPRRWPSKTVTIPDQRSLSKYILLVKILIYPNVKLLMPKAFQTNKYSIFHIKFLFEKVVLKISWAFFFQLRRKQISQHNLNLFNSNKTDFVLRCVTLDKIWIMILNWNKRD